MAVAAPITALQRKSAMGYSWNAIIAWRLQDVLQEIADSGLALHEAYTRYGVSRVSCAFCIMSSSAGLLAASTCEDNWALYVSIVELEAASGFGFQGSRWLADVAPHLLSAELLARVERAKAGAAARVAWEAVLPVHLLYTKGWPTALPSREEAELIAQVRRGVATAVGIDVAFTDGSAVTERYAELLERKSGGRVEGGSARPSANDRVPRSGPARPICSRSRALLQLAHLQEVWRR
jgi:hypothetical protein